MQGASLRLLPGEPRTKAVLPWRRLSSNGGGGPPMEVCGPPMEDCGPPMEEAILP
jgi:hypothetical protein